MYVNCFSFWGTSSFSPPTGVSPMLLSFSLAHQMKSFGAASLHFAYDTSRVSHRHHVFE